MLVTIPLRAFSFLRERRPRFPPSLVLGSLERRLGFIIYFYISFLNSRGDNLASSQQYFIVICEGCGNSPVSAESTARPCYLFTFSRFHLLLRHHYDTKTPSTFTPYLLSKSAIEYPPVHVHILVVRLMAHASIKVNSKKKKKDVATRQDTRFLTCTLCCPRKTPMSRTGPLDQENPSFTLRTVPCFIQKIK